MTLQELQQTIDSWISEHGVRYFDEMTNMVLLMEEIGEMSRLMARKFGEQSFKNPDDDVNINSKISDEMADVIFVLGCLANQMDIDLTEAIRNNLDKKTYRDKDRHKRNEKLI